MRKQVVIIGGGPSGLLLAKLLAQSDIDCIVLEKHTKQHVLSRVRAGILEEGSVRLLEKAGVSNRLHKEGFKHDGIFLSSKNASFRIDFKKLVNKCVTVYGQTEITADLYNSFEKTGIIVNSALHVALDDLTSKNPKVSFVHKNQRKVVSCDFVIGCDGFHGVTRQQIPNTHCRVFERMYPFGWLGVLSETPPVSNELIYVNHENGFALASMRNERLSRYYIQTDIRDSVDNWSDQRFWDEIRRRLPTEAAETLITGSSIEKSIATLRSFVTEPMQYGNLFLVGDAAHIVPPTGAKGLNLAFSDVYYLHEAISTFYENNNTALVDQYSTLALKRIWGAIRFSWWMTMNLHKFPEQSFFDQRIQRAELDHLINSRNAQINFSQNYVGLPLK